MIEHPEAERVDPIAGDVHAIWRDSHERYGARKIKAALERRGVTASRRRIASIMKRRGMTSAYTRRTFKPHKTRADEARLANILDREFDGYEPRTHLAGDLTYVRVGGKWAYACLLADLANRSIAGHSADTCVLMLLYIVKRLGVLFWVGDGVDPLDGPLLEFGKVACAAFDLADAARGHAERLADLLLGDVPADA